ncbi:MAG TPA: PIN domain-containing protein [Verrucomicrobiae bacterium]|nr:PIN domain-containing protein [Verrucomicrobiae bacterium]
MRVYADTSFLVRLVTEESGTEAAQAEYRRLGRPPLFYLPLHSLEVTNAIRQRAFHLRRSAPASERAAIKREMEIALSLLSKFIARRVLIESSVDMDKAIETARALSAKHTERLGCRGFDLLHVALALELECETFLTADRIQGALARAEGLDVTVSTDQ